MLSVSYSNELAEWIVLILDGSLQFTRDRPSVPACVRNAGVTKCRSWHQSQK